MAETYYTPGVCNLNPAETKRRRAAGYLGVGLAVVIFAILAIWRVAPAYGFVLFVPAWLAAIGFLQAKNHFCVSFAASGIYSADDTSKTAEVETAAHKQDQARARRLNLQALAIGVVGGVVGFGLLWLLQR